MSAAGGPPHPGPYQPDPSGQWPPSGGQEQVLVVIGDMAVTPTRVMTPAGPHPLGGTHWIVQENVQHSESTPTWAIVLAIVTVVLFIWLFLLGLLGLLFLLAKERKTTGYVQVSVQGPGFFHATQMPVYNPLHVGHIHQQVNYVRGIAAAAPPATG
jgi:hypothetical protein